jgi:hypothetical protein
MYKVQINIADWDFMDDEILTVETSDFEKVQIIQEFIEFQKEYGWAVDYDVTDEFIAEQFDDAGIEFDEDEEYVYDEDTDAWYWYDEDADTWYVHDEEADDWVEYVEEESEDEESEDEAPTVTSYVITRIEE